MQKSYKTTARVLAAGFAMATLGSAAFAGVLGGGFVITAENEFGTAYAEISMDSFTYTEASNPADSTWEWNLEAPIDLYDGDGDLIASLSEAHGFYKADPIVTLGFFVTAGGADTHFTITSALLSFGMINGAVGQASVGMTLTDADHNGATMTGNYDEGKAYRAYYNGFAPGGSVFTSQIGTYSVGSGGSDVRAGVDGFRAVGANVSDMSAQFDFTVTANDLAGGTARYEVVPEPASIGAIAMGLGALAMRRRNRK